VNVDLLELVVRAVEVDLVARPQTADDVDLLADQVAPVDATQAGGDEFVVEGADAEAGDHAARAGNELE
jgi:hypothetical protein